MRLRPISLRRRALESKRTPTVWFAGGGTGGHLAPGLSLANWLLKTAPIRCQFLTSGRSAERSVLRGAGMSAIEHPLPIPDNRWNRLRYGAAMTREVASMMAHFIRVRPHCLIGLGAYGSVPAALAAAAVGVPVFLLEQNVLPGKANRLLSRWATEIYAQWDESLKYFAKPERVRVLGNPVRSHAMLGSREEALARFELDPHKKTILVMGGSQGSVAINSAILEAAPCLARYQDQIQWIHLTGERAARVWKGALKNTSLSSVVLPYLDRIELAYAAADLVISRAGGTTIAELLARGIPSVLVPYPQAAEDHQLLNAQAVSTRGACRVVSESDFTPVSIRTLIEELVLQDHVRLRMARAARAAGRADATRDIGGRLLEVLGVEPTNHRMEVAG